MDTEFMFPKTSPLCKLTITFITVTFDSYVFMDTEIILVSLSPNQSWNPAEAKEAIKTYFFDFFLSGTIENQLRLNLSS